MNDLTIKQNTQIKETNVPASTITKLVLLSKSGTNMELVGWIGILGGIKKSEKDYMDQHYGNNGELLEWLTIDAPKIYLDFEDPAVETIMMSVASSDGVGVTVEDAAALLNNLFPSFENNTNITSFDELKEFTNVTQLISNFRGCTNLTSVDLSNILYIGNLAFTNSGISGVINLPKFIKFNYSYPMLPFSNCTNITEINFGPYIDATNGISTDSTLTNLTNLTKVTGLSNITNIGKGTFSGDINLEYIDLDFSKLSVLNNALFKDCKKLFTNLDLSPCISITSIGNDTFHGCTSLLSITLPNTLTSIGDSAFQSCVGLTSIDVPNSVTYIGNYAFNGCSGLTSVTIGSGVTSIGNGAFSYCRSLTSIDIPDGVTSIEDNAFGGCSSLLNIDIDWSKIITIGNGAFQKTSSLAISNLSIPNLTKLNNYVFRESGIISISDLGSILTVAEGVFWNCSDLVSVVLPNTVTTIQYDTFRQCPNLLHVNLPTSCTNIKPNAFSECSNLDETYDLSNIATIGSGAFASCNKLTISNFPRVSTYSPSTFYGIANTSITIPKEVELIKGECFRSLQYLLTITFESGSLLTLIEYDGFAMCPNLLSVVLPEGITTIGSNCFNGCNRLYYIEFPSTLTSIGDGQYVGGLNNYTGSSTVIFRGTTPPSCSATGLGLFGLRSPQSISIYVPDASVNTYKTHAAFSYFSDRIFGLSQLPNS